MRKMVRMKYNRGGRPFFGLVLTKPGVSPPRRCDLGEPLP